MKKILPIFFLAIIILGSCSKKEESYSSDFFAMDTFMRITAYGENSESAVKEAEMYINKLENKISRTRENSEIYKLNKNKKAVVSDETAEVLNLAVRFSEKTQGKFDITISGISDLWQIGTENQRIPEQGEIEEAIKTVDYRNIIFNDNNEVELLNGSTIDLGGIGKGYAADKVTQILKNNGINKAIIALAGNVYVLGGKDNENGWRVGIANPENPAESIAVIEAREKTIVTTGDYERYFEEGGIRYHHVFDVKTGYPADSDLTSVTVISENSVEADAYSTALYIMGVQKGIDFCEKNSIDAVFATKDKKMYTTSGVKDVFSFEGESAGYRYE